MQKTIFLFWVALVTSCAVDNVDIGSTKAPLIGVDDSDKIILDQYIVMFKQGVTTDTVEHEINYLSRDRTTDFRLMHRYKSMLGFAARFSPTALASLRNNPDVDYIEPDRTVTLATNVQPATSLRSIVPAPSQGMDRIDQCCGPLNGTYDNRERLGFGVDVWVVNTGIDAFSPEFAGRLSAGFTSISDGGGTQDCNGFGSRVAAAAAGTTFGIASLAPLHPIRVLNCSGAGSISGIIAGIDFITTNHPPGPNVAIFSFGGPASVAMDNAVSNMIASGVTAVVTAGFGGANACNLSPARITNAITVATTNPVTDEPLNGNPGSCVDIHAPAAGTCLAGKACGSPVAPSGQFFAEAYTAGVAAMVLDADPVATPSEVASAIYAAANACDCGNRITIVSTELLF